MDERPFQAYVQPFGETCYGCGQHNAHGLRIQSRWEGVEAVCRWTPEPHHMAQPGILNGGVIATLMDCHCACTASAAAVRAEGRTLADGAPPVYVTGSLRVEYRRPTPMDTELEVRARVAGVEGRRMTLACRLLAGGTETATGEVVMVRLRQH